MSMVSLIFLVAAVLFLIGYFKPKPGGIFIDSLPVSKVYVNGEFVGKTPYNGVYRAEEVTIKLIPESEEELLPFETKLNLVSGIQIVVRREFGKTEEDSSGDIISFDRVDPKESGVVTISIPENAQVSLDGIPRGFTPYKTSSVVSGEHQITVKALGYVDRTVVVKVLEGYRLTVFVKLGISKKETQATSIPDVKKYVEILNTPTGFLRVRTEPGTKGEEIAEVKPGSKYQFLEEDAETGWFKIQYSDPKPGLPNGIVGWVSNQYTRLNSTD